MSKLLIILISLLAFSCNVQEKDNLFQWTLKQERIHNENRNDSTKRSLKCWENDSINFSLNGKPMIKGVFPVPDYDFADSTFNGVGYSGDWKGYALKSRKVIYHSLYVNKSNVNKEFINDKPNEVFFSIVILTDSIDLKKYTHTGVSISSRNHPHYIGQGFVKTKSNEIDFTAFISADRNSYAIVNMRLFDLRIGRLILIAPKKDGTMRSLQLDSPIMSSDETDKHIKELLGNNNKVIEFFTKTGNI